MRDLDLKIHPPLDTVTRNYALACLAEGTQPLMHNPDSFGFGTRKRLTDPELAAEWWHALFIALRWPTRKKSFADPVGLKRRLEMAQTIRRFAVSPHYDELS